MKHTSAISTAQSLDFSPLVFSSLFKHHQGHITKNDTLEGSLNVLFLASERWTDVLTVHLSSDPLFLMLEVIRSYGSLQQGTLCGTLKLFSQKNRRPATTHPFFSDKIRIFFSLISLTQDQSCRLLNLTF